MWHGPLVDVALLFGVEGRKQHQYHPLRHIAASVLKADVDHDAPHDPLESARFAMRLARREAKQSVPTPHFPLRAGDPCELLVRNVPSEWGQDAATRLLELCPWARQDLGVHWLLSETDPTDWRGSATLVFPTAAVRDESFESLVGLTDVHVQWQDSPGAPPLGQFLTEQALVKAFSYAGVVVCARIPRKPITREPQSFAFISFADSADAKRMCKQKEVEVQITPTWTLTLRPKLAKYGNASDKRVAVRCGATVHG